MRLVLYLAMLCGGVIIGRHFLTHSKLLDRLGKLQMAALCWLLFIMGIRIGADDTVLNSLWQIGGQAFLFAIGSISVGIILVTFYIRWIQRGKQE